MSGIGATIVKNVAMKVVKMDAGILLGFV